MSKYGVMKPIENKANPVVTGLKPTSFLGGGKKRYSGNEVGLKPFSRGWHKWQIGQCLELHMQPFSVICVRVTGQTWWALVCATAVIHPCNLIYIWVIETDVASFNLTPATFQSAWFRFVLTWGVFEPMRTEICLSTTIRGEPYLKRKPNVFPRLVSSKW